MELAEPIERINKFLLDQFGRDTESGQAIWRVVWSDDQFEKRLVNTTPDGLHLITPVMREVPKYRQWVQQRYILERLVIVPDFQQIELAGILISYEPVWTFADKDLNYIPPTTIACKFIIDQIYAVQGKKSLRKYVDEEEKNPKEVREARVNKLQEELFGNETRVGDALAHKTGIVVP